MKTVLKKWINRSFNQLGYEIKKCQVSESKKYDWLKAYQIKTIFDIGANTGEWAAEIAGHFPDCQIYAFEPLASCFDALRKKAAGIQKISAYNFALGAGAGTEVMHRSEYAASSSLLPMSNLHKEAFPFTKDHFAEEIEIKTLDGFVSNQDIDDNILIKIDVQGYELEVINGGIDFIPRARVLLLETSFYPLYEGQPLFADVYEKLTGMGFDYMGEFESIKNPRNGAVLQGNSIFINRKYNHRGER